MESFELSDKLKIKVYSGSIFDPKIECDAITISVFTKLLFEQNIGLVKLALDKFGSKLKKNFEKEIEKLSGKFALEGQCIVIKTEKKIPKYLCNTILVSNCSKNLTQFENLMKQSLENMIEKLNQYGEIKTIAIPLLATGLNKGPINLCVDILVDGLLDFEKKGKIKFLKEIHLVNIEDTKTQVIVQKLRKIFNINLYHNLRDENQKSLLVSVQDVQDDAGKDDIELPQKNNNNEIKTNNNVKQCSFCKQKLRKVKLIDCGHSFCVGCAGVKDNITKCLIPDCSSNINDKKSSIDEIINKNENNDENICNICCNTCDSLKKLDKCGHELCDDCFKRIFEHKPQCPFCFIFYGIPKGDQPNGKMSYNVYKNSLPGYEKYDTIQINYIFPSGYQGKNHPNPGKKYSSTNRTAYLPASEEGFRALDLLKKAFDNNIIFTIGVSVTTGTEGITWNDIHHKTQISGSYGYPDPEYLQRLLEELKAHGIE